MNAVGYVRRSKESTDRTISLDVQEAQVRAYAERLGVEVPRVVVHDGISGGDSSRFVEIHDAIRQANAKVLIVYHLDRLARDTEAFLANCRILSKKGVDLHVVGRGRIDLTTASGKLLGTVEAAMAEHYRAVISEKTKDALALRRAQGKRVSRFAPFGYRFKLVGYKRDKRSGKRRPVFHVEPDPNQQTIVSQIYGLADAGASYREINEKLAVHLSTISTLLKRRSK